MTKPLTRNNLMRGEKPPHSTKRMRIVMEFYMDNTAAMFSRDLFNRRAMKLAEALGSPIALVATEEVAAEAGSSARGYTTMATIKQQARYAAKEAFKTWHHTAHHITGLVSVHNEDGELEALTYTHQYVGGTVGVTMSTKGVIWSVVDCPIMSTFAWEYTDTFGGEANYSWVRRGTFKARLFAPNREIMRKAKQEAGLTGVRGDWQNYGDMFQFDPRGMCTRLFVQYQEQSDDVATRLNQASRHP